MAKGINGLNKLQAKLRNAEKTLQNDISDAINKGAYEIEAQSKLLAPVDTGYMRNTINTKTGRMEATISVTAEYGMFVEFGTSKQAPQPFFYIVFEQMKEQIIKDIEKRIGGSFK